MKRVFADSFYFFALVSDDDLKHQQAVDFAAEFHGELITTAWVLVELADGLARPIWRNAFLALRDKLIRSPRVQIEPCSDELFDAGIELYRGRPDKSWSLTDCISFAVMQREKIAEALTGDRHFEQAGFTALFK